MHNSNLKLKTCHCNDSLDLDYLFKAMFDDKSRNICIEKSRSRQEEYCQKYCMMTLALATKQNQHDFVILEGNHFLNRYTHIIKIDDLRIVSNNADYEKRSKDESVNMFCKLCDENHQMPIRVIKNKLVSDSKCECNIF